MFTIVMVRLSTHLFFLNGAEKHDVTYDICSVPLEGSVSDADPHFYAPEIPD